MSEGLKTGVPSSGTTQFAARTLLAWYDRRRRDLPWRREPSPYRTLVSEFMLQQTVVAAVVPFFERFVARFPDLGSLATASEEDVVPLWSGLGYYARARNLHRAARTVVERYDGQIPRDEDTLRTLPGVGPYTAAAIAAIAFGRRTFALDGNAARVVARVAAVSTPIDGPAARGRLREIGLAWVPARRPGDFAQAVMELGATVCLARTPACEVCPVSSMCAARRLGTTLEIPVKQKRPVRRVVRLASVRLRSAGRVLLVRREDGLLAGTWMLPSRAMADGEASAAAARWALRELGIAPPRLERAGAIRHLFTHRDVIAEVFDARAFPVEARVVPDASEIGARVPTPEWRWVDERQLHEVATSSFLRKQLRV